MPTSPCSVPAHGAPRSRSSAGAPAGARACGAATARTSRSWRVSRRSLPGAPSPDSLHLMPELGAAIDGVDDVLLAVPSHGFRALLQQLQPLLPPAVRLCWATKGFEQGSGMLSNAVAQPVLGPGRSVAVLSGPTFATEVGAGLPTAMTIASSEIDYAEK